VDDVKFSQNIEWARMKDDASVLSSSPGGGTGGKVCNVFFCLSHFCTFDNYLQLYARVVNIVIKVLCVDSLKYPVGFSI